VQPGTKRAPPCWSGRRPELRTVRHRLPDETFEEERDFGRAKALTYGGGHTESDAFLLVPEAGVLVAGDLVVVAMQPWSGHGDPRSWAEILDRMLELDWDTCVPGHGPVCGRDVLPPLRDYQLALDEAVRGGDPEPELPTEFRDWAGAGDVGGQHHRAPRALGGLGGTPLVAGARWSFRGKDAGSVRTRKVRARLRTPHRGRAARSGGTD
jgi:glyoxylase-like metal-dependent hydrolase (beta-lactamase superfamily II)